MDESPLLKHVGYRHIETDVVLEALLLQAENISVILAQKLLLVVAIGDNLLLN